MRPRVELPARGSGSRADGERGDSGEATTHTWSSGTPDDERTRLLAADLPADAQGGRIVALTVSPPVRVQERGGEGARSRSTLELGELQARTPGGRVVLGGYDDWLAVNGVEADGRRTAASRSRAR